jgi:hypothetical protein
VQHTDSTRSRTRAHAGRRPPRAPSAGISRSHVASSPGPRRERHVAVQTRVNVMRDSRVPASPMGGERAIAAARSPIAGGQSHETTRDDAPLRHPHTMTRPAKSWGSLHLPRGSTSPRDACPRRRRGTLKGALELARCSVDRQQAVGAHAQSRSRQQQQALADRLQVRPLLFSPDLFLRVLQLLATRVGWRRWRSVVMARSVLALGTRWPSCWKSPSSNNPPGGGFGW